MRYWKGSRSSPDIRGREHVFGITRLSAVDGSHSTESILKFTLLCRTVHCMRVVPASASRVCWILAFITPPKYIFHVPPVQIRTSPLTLCLWANDVTSRFWHLGLSKCAIVLALPCREQGGGEPDLTWPAAGRTPVRGILIPRGEWEAILDTDQVSDTTELHVTLALVYTEGTLHGTWL